MIQSPRFAGPSEEHLVPSHLQIDNKIPTWGQATRRFCSLIDRLEQIVDAYQVLDFEPFTSDWANAAWSELYRIDKIASKWAEATVLLRFSGSYWLDRDSKSLLPPVTYLSRLQSSKQARQKALSRALADIDRWQSVRTIGGTGYKGYPHVFVGLYLSDTVQKDVFTKVIRSHVENCPIAQGAAHDTHEVVSINKSPPQHKSKLIHSLGQNIPALNTQTAVTAESWEKQRMATALHGGGWRAYSFGLSN
jgi:hypothetical protein